MGAETPDGQIAARIWDEYIKGFQEHTINFYVGKGYDSLEVIYTLLSYNEFKHQMILEHKDNSNKRTVYRYN